MSKKHFINYSDINFKKSQNFSILMAKLFGGFDEVCPYGPEDLELDFIRENKEILQQRKGAGLFLWKPYIILKYLNSHMDEGDYLFYADAGSFFVRNVQLLIVELERNNQPIMGFDHPFLESQWTKLELLQYFSAEKNLNIHSSKQCLGGFILVKKCDESIRFFDRFLNIAKLGWSLNENYTIKQFDWFVEHRHDQSIFSLLYKTSGYVPFKDPSQLGLRPISYFNNLQVVSIDENNIYTFENGWFGSLSVGNGTYPYVIFSNRRKNPVKAFFKYKIICILTKLGLYEKNFR